MGFIKDTAITSLWAYLTQTGRKYLVDGNKIDFQIKHFSLGDPDVNYLQASQPAGDNFNTLPSGFVPDISGIGDASLTGVAGGVAQNFTLKGGAAVGQLGTSGIIGDPITSVGFSSNTQSVFLNKTSTGYQLLSFDVLVKLSSQSPIGAEGVKVFVVPPSQGTSNDLYHAISTDGIVQWDAIDGQEKPITININLNKPEGSYKGKIVLKLVAYKSVLNINPTSSTMTIDVRINITNPSITLSTDGATLDDGTGSGSTRSATDSGSGSGSVFSLGFPNY